MVSSFLAGQPLEPQDENLPEAWVCSCHRNFWHTSYWTVCIFWNCIYRRLWDVLSQQDGSHKPSSSCTIQNIQNFKLYNTLYSSAKILSQTRPSRFYITATTYQPRDPEVIVFNPVRRAINTFILDLFHQKNKNNMRPSPRLFQQAARAPSMLQRFANSPMSPPVEAYPLFVLITGMVSPPLFCLSFQMQKDHSLFSLSDSFVLTRLFSCFFSCRSACTLHIASSSTTAI